MKKMSFRSRTTLLTAVCLSVACFAMYASLLWLADAQIVQIVELGPVDAGLTLPEQSPRSSQMMEGVVIGEEITAEEMTTEEMYGLLAQSGLQNFKVIGMLIMLLVIICGSVFSWIAAGISIAPVKQLCKKIETIDGQQMKLDVGEFSAGDELSKLADSFSRMMDRIQTAFEREKRFSMAAAHELKTPLAVMQSSIDILALSNKPTLEEYEEAIDDIGSQVTRLGALVTDLLAFAKMGKLGEGENIQVCMVVEDLLEAFSNQHTRLSIQKELNPITIVNSRVLLERAIYNLLDNAAKYSPEDSTITVKLFQQQDWCILKVSDQGCGISEEAIEHIFEPFYREELSRNRSIAGAGLGLSFVKEFADSCGGHISCNPASPCGTEFTLRLPMSI